MKILQVGKFYPIRGGVEKVMYDLMLGLSEREIHCDMLCASTENFPETDIVINQYAKLFVVSTQIKVAATMLAPKMISKLRSIANQYDVIHIHHPDPMATLSLFLAGFKGKVVLHWHSDILKQKTLLKLYKPLQDWLIKRADLIVGTSPIYVKESQFLTKVQEKIAHIPIGVEPLLTDSTKANLIIGRFAGKKILFALGRLVEYKGYPFLIDAIQGLDDSYHLLIGGIGPLREQLENQVKALNLQDKITFLGFIADEDVPNYFKACDIFCLSSTIKTEAFAIVQIEAMSLGKPVISTRIPGSGVSWVNEHEVSGLTVPIENVDDFRNAILRLGENKEFYDRLSKGASERFQQNFTLDKMIDKTITIYKSL
ncbi:MULTISPECIES: glycosyltransferase [Sphingobacterium]|uniref:Glycosyltransferase n=1 Tax=Sphingobacterium tenebrionis TaxID=3111775 RepID=A0ABU8I6Q8_9SPHI|nr:glycosyltransferase [Sphingobacterium sp. CZ-2]QBR11241.1 glycosyltransferase [Sphingobacterium sp. CZ-2]